MNDNDPETHETLDAPDSHGRAALLLVESLIHGLCEDSMLTPQAAAEIVERAANVQLAHIDEAIVESASMRGAHTLLSSIAASIRIDVPDESSPIGG